MIPNAKEREVTSSGVTATGSFGISSKDEAHLMSILRDNIYSDKILAVQREYSANAWDAHRMVGKPELPIKVTLPTAMEPVLIIQDFGPGLSQEDVFEVYTRYGASTKRGDDNAVGMLGIGSKSGFAYSDSFTVTSCHGGLRKVYVAVIDKSQRGMISLLHEEDCGDETGVSIQIAVRPHDVWEFTEKAKKLFQYFEPRPDINITLPPAPTSKMALKNGIIYDTVGEAGWTAVMGCVPYKVDVKQLEGMEVGVPAYIAKLHGALYFNIGEVEVSASREELKYSDETKKALVKKLNDLTEEFVSHSLEAIEKGNFTVWEQRLKIRVLDHLGLPVPKEYRDLAEVYVHMVVPPKTFTVSKLKTRTQDPDTNKGIGVNAKVRLLLRDDNRATMGYQIGAYDYLIRAVGGATWEEVRKELDALLVTMKLTGVPISRISQEPWTAPAKGNYGKLINAKHKQKAFRFRGGHVSRPFSDSWEAVDRVPTDKDIFVIISGFEANYPFFSHYKEDRLLSVAFGDKSMPDVYGYKNTERRPIDDDDCVGTEYLTWRKAWVKTLMTPKVQEILDHWQWSTVVGHTEYYWQHGKVDKKKLQAILDDFGPDHLISTLFEMQAKGKEFFKKNKYDSSLLEVLDKRTRKETEPSEAQQVLADVLAQYPLFGLSNTDLSLLWGNHGTEWGNYVKLIDSIREGIV